MLTYKFTEVRTISQAIKQFNRIDPTGADRARAKGGRAHGRPQRAEDVFAKMIKAGDVQVIRRRGQPPLVKLLMQPNETTIAALNEATNGETETFADTDAMITALNSEAAE